MGMYPLSLLESRVAAQGMELCIDSRKATPGCVFVALPGNELRTISTAAGQSHKIGRAHV